MKPNKKLGIDKNFSEGVRGVSKSTIPELQHPKVVLNKKNPTYPAKMRGELEVIGITTVGYKHIQILSINLTAKIYGIKFTYKTIKASDNSNTEFENQTVWIIHDEMESHVLIDTNLVIVEQIVFILPENSLDSELHLNVTIDNKDVPDGVTYYAVP